MLLLRLKGAFSARSSAEAMDATAAQRMSTAPEDAATLEAAASLEPCAALEAGAGACNCRVWERRYGAASILCSTGSWCSNNHRGSKIDAAMQIGALATLESSSH